jgi:hypothetical protein
VVGEVKGGGASDVGSGHAGAARDQVFPAWVRRQHAHARCDEEAGFGEELDPEVARRGAEGSAQPDLGAAFEECIQQLGCHGNEEVVVT